jgi:hypothetical protein
VDHAHWWAWFQKEWHQTQYTNLQLSSSPTSPTSPKPLRLHYAFDLVWLHYSSSIHVHYLAITGWQPEMIARVTWFYMTSHEDHSDEHATTIVMSHYVYCRHEHPNLFKNPGRHRFSANIRSYFHLNGFSPPLTKPQPMISISNPSPRWTKLKKKTLKKEGY